MFGLDCGSFIIGLCCGIIVMGIIAGHAHKAQVKELEERNKEDKLGYQRSIEALSFEVERLKGMLPAIHGEELVEEYHRQQQIEEYYNRQKCDLDDTKQEA